jgi:hypothetical protein
MTPSDSVSHLNKKPGNFSKIQSSAGSSLTATPAQHVKGALLTRNGGNDAPSDSSKFCGI